MRSLRKGFFAPHRMKTSRMASNRAGRAAATNQELNELRIRQFATMRRAVYRSRSYAIIVRSLRGYCRPACLGRGKARRGVGLANPAGCATGRGGLPLSAAGWCLRRALDLHREGKHSSLDEPTSPPDFSSFEDGNEQSESRQDVQ